eukprot:CAMPEP_0197394426 /NCGR_PEP_ID=MMETSP1165-20131217/5213_1 /TAXON_ID=284809 /ORGANISM="Chrysocystis fragilis, Strain CCMP3189" /LENGTH=200 /DNA_ID=CAMNT_0042920131 /DNA_START=19 /DNA_END=621 /DNA_ORIENTATION=+
MARLVLVASSWWVVARALVATPPGVARVAPVRMSWQPNEDYNTFGPTGRLTDFERSARDAGATDRKVTIRKPLGLVLDQNGAKDVYVKEVVPGGNAEAIGGISKGDIISMCSATFGNEMWSTRGAGLDRVIRAIEVRAGNSVSLVVQSKAEQKNFLSNLFSDQDGIRERRIQEAEQKRQVLEDEIKAERKEAAKKWFGLF